MSASELQFWFEFGSTYSYLAAARIGAVGEAQGVAVSWRPFLLGPIFGEQGWNDSPFNLYPAKGRYMWRDMERLCAELSLPFRRPTEFPRNGLLAARVALALSDPRATPDFARAVYRANFAEDRDIADPDTLTGILGDLGHPPELLDAANAPENKERLREQTGEAARLGIFGAPTFVVSGELFWGNDRLEGAFAWSRREGR